VTWTAVGGEPSSGGPSATFTTHWPCIGGKAAEAHLGTSHYAKGVTVVLPTGCREGSGYINITADYTLRCPESDCKAEPTAFGCTARNPNASPNPSGPIDAVYNGCAWAWQVDITFHRAYGLCPENFTDICGIGDIDPNDRTEAYITSVIQALLSGGTTAANCGACTWLHETVHKNAFDEAIADGAQDLGNNSSLMAPLPIDCADPNTTSCQAAENSTQWDAIADEIDFIRICAEAAQASVEGEAEAASDECNAGVGCELCYYAGSQPGWDLPEECSACPW